MRILCVTSDRVACGVAEYSAQLIEAMAPVAPEIEWETCGPEPPAFFDVDLLWLNHHQALHSMWNDGSRVKVWQGLGVPVVVTQHDTYETLQIMLDRGHPDFRGADALIVHEPVEGLEGSSVHVIRQGVLPCNPRPLFNYPLLGTAGRDFPWKHFDLVEKASFSAGWGHQVLRDWLPREDLVAKLSECFATAFLYQTGNSGTSGAIRLGIAARRPVFAFKCRQFRDLFDEPAITFVDSEADLVERLQHWDSGWAQEQSRRIVELAAQDSWAHVAERYAAIFKSVL